MVDDVVLLACFSWTSSPLDQCKQSRALCTLDLHLASYTTWLAASPNWCQLQIVVFSGRPVDSILWLGGGLKKIVSGTCKFLQLPSTSTCCGWSIGCSPGTFPPLALPLSISDLFESEDLFVPRSLINFSKAPCCPDAGPMQAQPGVVQPEFKSPYLSTLVCLALVQALVPLNQVLQAPPWLILLPVVRRLAGEFPQFHHFFQSSPASMV